MFTYRLLGLFGALMMLLAFSFSPVQAATIPVSSCAATDLVAAVNLAMNTPAADTIELNGGCTYLLTTASDVDPGSGNSGLRRITPGGGPLTINGNGAIIARSLTDGTPNFRIFRIDPGGNLSLNEVTISNGRLTSSNSFGGGIANFQGTLSINRTTLFINTAQLGGGIGNLGSVIMHSSLIQDNIATRAGGGLVTIGGTVISTDSRFALNHANDPTLHRGLGGGLALFRGARVLLISNQVTAGLAAESGGGIYVNSGHLTMTDSSVWNNTTGGDGGGIALLSATTARISSSTVEANSATDNGGGIHNRGQLAIFNSTIAFNSTGFNVLQIGFGGGVANLGMLAVVNSTFFGNFAPSNGTGGGIDNTGGTVGISNSTLSENSAGRGGGASGTMTLANSIIANSIGGDCAGTLIFIGANLVEEFSCGASLSGDPNLADTLADNGGPTRTLALLPGSGAINAGINANIPPGVTIDQRGPGFPRIVGGRVDLGAFEVQN